MRRTLLAGLLLGAGLFTQALGNSANTSETLTAELGARSDQPLLAGTADPAQGAFATPEGERNDWRNAATPAANPVTLTTGHDTAVAVLPAGAVASTSGSCPNDMVEVEGQYCTEVRHNCTKWLDDPKLPYARCGEYEPKATCIGERVKMRFCIDRFEYTRPGDPTPMNHASFVIASDTCKAQGKRVCTENEWNFACEGEEMRPYPYGWNREAKCNQDRPKEDLYDPNNKQFQVLADRRMPAGANPECVSPFGVYDMVGNLDEPVLRESQRFAYPYRNGLKGGWWMPARNRCRPATTKHDDHYEDIQVGVRCCSDTPGSSAGATG